MPKNFIRHRYGFGVGNYLSAIILSHLQDDEATVDVHGKVYRPTKKSLKEKYLENFSAREHITEITAQKPSYLEEYRRLLPLQYHDKQLTDCDLDMLIYN